MLLTGQYEHTIDSKGRLAIPADVRSRWRAEDGDAWFAVPWFGGIVRLFTEAEYTKLSASVMPQTLALSERDAKLKKLLFSRSARLEVDTAGRVRIPEWMLKAVGLGREVSVLGCGDCLEVCNREDFSSSVEEDLKELAALLQPSGEGA